MAAHQLDEFDDYAAKSGTPSPNFGEHGGGSFRLRDWGISTPLGAPIPIIHCKTCSAVPAESDLPVILQRSHPRWKTSPLNQRRLLQNNLPCLRQSGKKTPWTPSRVILV